MTKALLFDFDGVLVDSSREVFFTSYCAVTGERPESFEEASSDAWHYFEKFHSLAFNAAGMIEVLRHWQRGVSEVTRASFERLNAHEQQAAQELLFGTREQLMSDYSELWCSLVDPYEPLWSHVEVLFERKAPIAIITNKNASAISALFKHHSGRTLPSELIYAGDSGGSKAERIQAYLEASGAREALFFEDSLPNLQEVASMAGVTGVLGLWGPVDQSDRDRARADKIATDDSPEAAVIRINAFLGLF